MSLTLPIQVGKQYVRRDGAVVTAGAPQPGMARETMWVGLGGEVGPAYMDSHIFAQTGRSSGSNAIDRPQDLIADHIPATGHPHAALMAQYAADAAETAEPWLRWQTSFAGSPHWADLQDHPGWAFDYAYRRKPKTIRIGEHDVPEPLRRPIEQGADYWLVDLVNGRLGATECTNFTPSTASAHTALGLVHLTREAAEQHARALLAFTQVQA